MGIAKFWMVWNPAGRAPNYRHFSREQATAEAERLARIQPGDTFIVLEAVSESRSIRVETVALKPAHPACEEPPF